MYARLLPTNKEGKTLIVITRSGTRNGKNFTETVKSVGYLEDLTGDGPGQYPDPLAHFRQVAKDMTAAEKEDKALTTLTIRMKESLALGSKEVKNIGYLPLSHLWHELDLERFFANRQRNLKIQFNLSRIMRILLFARVLFPKSKRATYLESEQFFEKIDFALEDVYRALDHYDIYSQDLQLFLHKQMVEAYGRQTDLVYYDVTNYYFESEKTDTLRAKGVSKEHRPNPIIQMGLLMDKQGLPISYDLFRGNTSDCITLMPVLEKARKTFSIDRFVVVADRGLNSHKNTAMALAKGDGYIYGQSILKAPKEMKDYCISARGYRNYRIGCGQDSTGFKVKSRIVPRIIKVENVHGDMVDVEIDEKQVFFYSEKYAKRARRKRAEALRKSRKIINTPSLYKEFGNKGAQKYILGLIVDETSGELLESKKTYAINKQVIKEERKYDGYYAVISSELDWSDEKIMEHYHGLWKIEESFRLTKSELGSRPLFVNTPEHINAHFLICFLALLMTRLLEKKINYTIPLPQLLDDMRKAVGVPIDKTTYAFGHYTAGLKALEEAFNIDYKRRYLNRKEIIQMRKPR